MSSVYEEYISALSDYNNDLVADPKNRFQDRQGNYVYQNISTKKWILIEPPYYLNTPKHLEKLETEAQILNGQLQMDRNTIALTKSPSAIKSKVVEYNRGCETLTAIEADIRKFRKSDIQKRVEIASEMAVIMGKNNVLLETVEAGNDYVTRGAIHTIGNEIKVLHNSLITRAEALLSPVPEHLYQIKPSDIPKTPEGEEFAKLLQQWTEKSNQYKSLMEEYHQNNRTLESLEEDLENQTISLFDLGQGTVPAVREISEREAEQRRAGQTITPAPEVKTLKRIKVVLKGIPKKPSETIPPAAELASPKKTVPTKPPRPTAVAAEASAAAEAALAASDTASTAADTASTAAETALTAAETASTAAETASTAAETASTAAETASVAAELVVVKTTNSRSVLLRQLYQKDISKCDKGPAAGGYSIEELRNIAEKVGIVTKGMKKSDICSEIKRLYRSA